MKGAEGSKRNILQLSILSVFIFRELKGCEATEGFSPAKKSELEATLRTKPGSAFHLAQHHFTLTNCVPALMHSLSLIQKSLHKILSLIIFMLFVLQTYFVLLLGQSCMTH